MYSAHHGFSRSNTFYVASSVEARVCGVRHCASSRYSRSLKTQAGSYPGRGEMKGFSLQNTHCVLRVKNNLHMSENVYTLFQRVRLFMSSNRK